jgi:DNA-binding NtrC family response regulator
MSEYGPGERDVLVGLLELQSVDDLGLLVGRALKVIVHVTRSHGYLAVYASADRSLANTRWKASAEMGRDDVLDLERSISRGILADALCDGEVYADNALEDERWRMRSSCHQKNVRAVIAVPIGAPAIGVLYVGRKDPYNDQDRRLVTDYCRWLAPVVDRLWLQSRHDEADPVAAYRKNGRFARVVGSSLALAKVLQRAQQAASTERTVLIVGPTGSGKTLLAEEIHRASNRAGKEFVAVSCPNLHHEFVHDWLFGREVNPGYPNHKATTGLVDRAKGGTLFFDEIADIPLETQAKLLTFIDTKRFYRFVGTVEHVADVRLMFATNKDLDQLVRDGLFRSDLRYRIAELQISLPSLDQRPEDIEALVRDAVPRLRNADDQPVEIEPRAVRVLASRSWPGGVRELLHALQRGALHVGPAESIDVEHLFPDEVPAPPQADAPFPSMDQHLRDAEAELFLRAYDAAGKRMTRVCELLDLKPATAYNIRNRALRRVGGLGPEKG